MRGAPPPLAAAAACAPPVAAPRCTSQYTCRRPAGCRPGRRRQGLSRCRRAGVGQPVQRQLPHYHLAPVLPGQLPQALEGSPFQPPRRRSARRLGRHGRRRSRQRGARQAAPLRSRLAACALPFQPLLLPPRRLVRRRRGRGAERLGGATPGGGGGAPGRTALELQPRAALGAEAVQLHGSGRRRAAPSRPPPAPPDRRLSRCWAGQRTGRQGEGAAADRGVRAPCRHEQWRWQRSLQPIEHVRQALSVHQTGSPPAPKARRQACTAPPPGTGPPGSTQAAAASGGAPPAPPAPLPDRRWCAACTQSRPRST